jgi:hypothetical protein
MAGVKTNIVTAIEIRGRSAGDAPLFVPLVRTTRKNFTVNEISADKAYLSEQNIELAFESGARTPSTVPTGVGRTAGDRPPRAGPVSDSAWRIHYLILPSLFW